MKIKFRRSIITTSLVVAAGWSIVAEQHVSAQQPAPQPKANNAITMEDPETGEGVTWWVIGTGAVLNSSNDQGEILSATVGQTAIDNVALPSTGSPHPSIAAYLGYWLPLPGKEQELVRPSGESDNTFALANHPNPFNSRTTISYLLPTRGSARLRVYDMTGRQVRLLLDAEQRAGTHAIVWDGRDDGGAALATGTYLYTLELSSGSSVTGSRTIATAHSMMYLVK